ncbi:MAG: hypothetical protein IM613_18935 [Cytophagales bacterium]|nr:hypothetical protein [Cytophagales bacterium]
MELRVKKVIAREYLIFIIPFTTIITVYYFYGGSRPNNFSGLIESIYYMAIDGSDGWGDDAGIYVPVCKTYVLILLLIYPVRLLFLSIRWSIKTLKAR